MLSELHTILNFSVKKWSKGPKKFKIIKLIKMVKIIKNDQFGQKIEKKLEKKNKSIEARDDARA